MRSSRRAFCALSVAAGAAGMLAPVRAVAQAAKPVRIKSVDIFPIEIPVPKEQAQSGLYYHYTVVKVETDVGVRGYCFDRGWNDRVLDSDIRPALVGKDLFAINDHLKAGLAAWGGVEHAIWDAIGKIAGQPVHRLLGGSKTSLNAYLSLRWKGKMDQAHVSFQEAVDMALRIKKAGFKGIKIFGRRPNPLDDATVCGEIRAAVGPDFSIMFDRTAQVTGTVWDYETGLKVARALEKHNVKWLEEPFHRDDFLSPARLAREVDIPIAGGERFQGLAGYRECFIHDSFDIIHVDPQICGGILMTRKVAALAEAFHKPVVCHGTMGLRLAGYLQASAAIGAEWQELALITPPLLPEEQWSPGLKVLNSKTVFTVRDGAIQVPQAPGLGLDVNEEALQRYRGAKDRRFFPMYEGVDETLKLT
jgi:D-galactarolactone cycloisomerase